MAKDWIQMRIERTTRRELERVRASMLTAELMGLIELEKDTRNRFSLDQVIIRLIAMRDKHAERVRRSRNRKWGGSTNGKAASD